MLVSFFVEPSAAVSVWQALSEADATKHSPTHSYTLATGGGSTTSMKRSRAIIYYAVLLTLPSKHIHKANQVFGVIFNCTTTQTQTHTRQQRWVAQNFMCCFPFLFVSATLGAVTLIPALQVAAQEAGLRNAGPCACLRSSSLVMRVWLTQLVCLSANWVGLREKKQSDIRGKC